MPAKILMPALSPTMEHGNLTKWIKKEGDEVKAGEVLAEIETDKATMEVEAVEEGTLVKIVIPEGTENIPVNSLIGVLLEEGEDAGSVEALMNKEQLKKPEVKKEESVSEVEGEKLESAKVIIEQPEEKDASLSSKPARIFASPLAKRIALNENIDLSSLTGTGPHGRIVKNDVLSSNSIAAKGQIRRNSEEYTSIPNNNMRKVIAKRLLESKQQVPHFYLSIECCMDNVIDSRAQINKVFGDDKGKKLSVNDFVILATAKSLKEVPDSNASWSESAVLMYNNVDISIAVAIDGGLITPIVRNADQKDIMSISKEVKDLAKRAKENNLKPEEYQGGGFSISNLGMYGIDNFNAIINPPQGCILAVGASVKKPVVIDDKIEIRNMMNVNLSCDHRVVDGVVGAKFLASFKKFIESPILMFV